jgi:uncharacterized protein (DUF885 family)
MLTMRAQAALLLFPLFALMPACMNRTDPQADFLLFEDEYFNELYKWMPSLGTQAGYHIFDDAIEDLSASAHRNRIAVVEAQLSRLRSIARDRLDEPQQIDHEFLEAQLEAERHQLAVLEGWKKNPMGYVGGAGNAIDLLMKRNFAPAAERARAAVSRLNGIPSQMAALRANVSNPPREFTELAIRVAEGSVPFFRDDIGKWGKESAGADLVLRDQFETANRRAVAALEQTAAWLKNDLLPRSNGSFAIGREAFGNRLRYEEMIDLPVDRLLALGEQVLERDYQAFVETARAIDPKLSPAEVMASLHKEHPTAANLIPFVKSSAESIRQFLIDKEIVTIPSEVRATIVETPPYLRAGGFAYMDTPGAFETRATEAFYYVTPPEKDWPPAQIEEHLRLFNRYVADIVTIHEAYPGHYVQFLYAPKFPTKTRRLMFVASNAEGWAHYTEQMMIEQGYGASDPRYRLAQLSEALLRDCRWVAGIQLHTAGWDVERATELFMTRGFQERAVALEEARRGTYDATYLYYSLGKQMVFKLRRDYESKLGPAYSIRKFHDAVLRQGSIPLPLLRRVMLGANAGPAI